MGWRAIRIGLDRPAILRQQLRALIRAAAGRPLAIMFPMVAEVAEFDQARRLLDMELARAAARGIETPADCRAGVMLEVPALLWQFDTIVRRADFVSVGSNDLVQFLFASDRGNPRLAERYDVLAPSVINLLRSVRETCDRLDTPVSICGEMAGEPLEAMALVGLGFRNLSMAPPTIGPVKEMIRSLDHGALVTYLDQLRDVADHSLRSKLASFARDHDVTF